MFGTFQQSHLRIEVEASSSTMQESLIRSSQLRLWLWPQRLDTGLPERLHADLIFSSWLGPVEIEHRVVEIGDRGLRLLLSKGIDGYHEWTWGDGWVQSRLEGVSLLPLNLAQTYGLMRLREFAEALDAEKERELPSQST